MTSHRHDTFHANIDITFPYIPCDIIGLNMRDGLNNAVNDYYGELHKHRLSKDGEDLSIESWGEKVSGRTNVAQRALKEFREGQGCRFEGFLELNRVPGNFYISTFDFQDIIMMAAQEGLYIDNSFTINHFSFGSKADFASIK